MRTAFRLLVGPALALLGASAAFADHRQPGSLLVYPEFDNRAGVVTVLTVTNSCPLQDGDVDVEFVYHGRYDREYHPLSCNEFNRTESLTPNDTLTLASNDHNPHHERGFVYVFAKSPATGEAIAFNHLIGSLLVVDGYSIFQFSVNATMYEAIGLGQGEITDLDGDGIRDLDGVEYEMAADQVLVPRFLGQYAGDAARTTRSATGELVLINLTGGADFAATLDFLIYNDDEEAFSASHTFTCWDRRPLAEISGIFTQDFLRNATAHSPLEDLGGLEYGWFEIDGGIANSTAISIDDPAFIALFIEGAFGSAAADAPFEIGHQDNGDLLARGVTGDS